jgi:hypothetical protein
MTGRSRTSVTSWFSSIQVFDVLIAKIKIYRIIILLVILFLFDNVIYVFLLLWLCILIECLCMATLTEVFRAFSSVVRQIPG